MEGGSEADAAGTSLHRQLARIRAQIQGGGPEAAKSGADRERQPGGLLRSGSQGSSPSEPSVLLLGRYNHIAGEIPDEFRKKKPGWDVVFRTMHSAKGLEADYVVVFGLERGKFGFPTGIADDPLLQLVLGAADDFPNAEERRLFYVALTRAKKKVFLLVKDSDRSSFVDELMSEAYSSEVLNPQRKFAESGCPGCGGRVLPRSGPYGRFWSCEFFPICEGKLRICKKCETGAVALRNRAWKCNFEGCREEYESCSGMGCDGYFVAREGKYGPFLGCSTYPECEATEGLPFGAASRAAEIN